MGRDKQLQQLRAQRGRGEAEELSIMSTRLVIREVLAELCGTYPELASLLEDWHQARVIERASLVERPSQIEAGHSMQKRGNIDI